MTAGDALDRPSDGEPRMRWRSSDVVVAETAISLYLGLKRQLYWVEVVEPSKAKLLAQAIWK